MSFQSSKPKRADKGKWAEARAQDWLDARLKSEYGFAYHRYPDARSARGALAAQPADFLVAHKKYAGIVPLSQKVVHLEVKETAELKRLPKTKIGQYGKLKLFLIAGITPVVLVYRSAFEDWYIFWAHDLFEYPECPASFPFTSNDTYPTASAALERIFQ